MSDIEIYFTFWLITGLIGIFLVIRYKRKLSKLHKK